MPWWAGLDEQGGVVWFIGCGVGGICCCCRGGCGGGGRGWPGNTGGEIIC